MAAAQLMNLLQEHLSRRPGMEPRDVYKLLYQGVRGPEHLITSPAAFLEQLAEEWQAIDAKTGDPLWESIRTDGSLLRLNLRAYKSLGGSLDKLGAACLETAHRTWGTPADLQQAWESFVSASKDQPWPGLSLEAITSFTSWLETHLYPAVHHSERYRRLYRPAYRLVAAEIYLPEIRVCHQFSGKGVRAGGKRGGEMNSKE